MISESQLLIKPKHDHGHHVYASRMPYIMYSVSFMLLLWIIFLLYQLYTNDVPDTLSNTSESGFVPVWGIAGSGRIAHDFSVALKMSKSKIKAFAAGSKKPGRKERSTTLASIFNATGYESYTELADDPDINIVYISTTNQLHFEVAEMMLSSGKNVLVEKPTGLNETQTKTMIELANKYNLFFGTNYWTRFFPAFQRAREVIERGEIGNIREIRGDMGFEAVPYAFANGSRYFQRFFDPKLGGGVLLDLGCYLIQYATLFSQALSRGMPNISVSGEISERLVDVAVDTMLYWNDNFGRTSATLSLSFQRSSTFSVDVIGTHGVVTFLSQANCPGIVEIVIYKNAEDITSLDPQPRPCCSQPLEKHYKIVKPIPPWPKQFSAPFYPDTTGFIYVIKATEACLKSVGCRHFSEIHPNEEILVMKIADSIRDKLFKSILTGT